MKQDIEQPSAAHQDGIPVRQRPYQRPTLEQRGSLAVITAGAVISGISDGTPSDLRLKEDIRQIGTTAHSLPFYSFRYRGQPGVYEGVMAQDVLQVMPEAVSRGPDGYLRVKYGKLGVPFRRIH